jgi:hypothetical protein
MNQAITPGQRSRTPDLADAPARILTSGHCEWFVMQDFSRKRFNCVIEALSRKLLRPVVRQMINASKEILAITTLY